MRGSRSGWTRWLAALVTVAFLAGAAVAETVWILPGPPAAAPGETVAVRLQEGDPFHGRERAARPGDGAPGRLWGSGRETLRAKPELGFIAREAGLQLITWSGASSRRADGAEAGRYCKAFIVVGEPAPGGQLHLSEVGHLLEIVPQTDPARVAGGAADFELQLLFEREPLADVTVEALPASDPSGGVRRMRTDEIGLARLSLDRPGLWMIRAAHGGASSTLVLSRGDAR